MTIENIGLFQGLSAKMRYLNQRQTVISQNIANADTPNYKPQDLKPIDFGAVLESAQGKTKSVRLGGTDSEHFSARGKVLDDFSAKKQSHAYEVSPSGNAVILEEQMMKAAQTTMDYTMTSNLYMKNMNMLRTAIGQGAR